MITHAFFECADRLWFHITNTLVKNPRSVHYVFIPVRSMKMTGFKVSHYKICKSIGCNRERSMFQALLDAHK